MKIAGTRLGDIEIEDEKVLFFENGLLGFQACQRYVVLETDGNAPVAWLQSLDRPEVAFPVVDGATFAEYPEPSAASLAAEHGFDPAETVVLVVIAVQRDSGEVYANLLAPLLIDATSRKGVQVILDARRYSARTRYAPEEQLDSRVEPVAEAAMDASIEAAGEPRAAHVA